MDQTALHSHHVYGLRLESSIAFPELDEDSPDGLPNGPEEGDADLPVVIRLGRVPRLSAVDDDESMGLETSFYFASPQRVVLEYPGIGRFDIRDGREIVVEADSQAEAVTLRSFLLGAGLAAVLHQRQQIVLHASGVVLGDQAVLFIGEKGAGKSTLTAALNTCGHPFVTDDIAPLRHQGDGFVVAPGFARQRLWPDALRHLNRAVHRLPRLHSTVEKRLDRIQGPIATGHQPVQSICVLGYGPPGSEEFTVTPLHGTEAFQEIVRHTFVPANVIHRMNPAWYFSACTELLDCVPVYRIGRPRDLQRLADLVQHLERHHAHLERAA